MILVLRQKVSKDISQGVGHFSQGKRARICSYFALNSSDTITDDCEKELFHLFRRNSVDFNQLLKNFQSPFLLSKFIFSEISFFIINSMSHIQLFRKLFQNFVG